MPIMIELSPAVPLLFPLSSTCQDHLRDVFCHSLLLATMDKFWALE